MASNICNYSPMINLSLREINGRLKFIHRYLCAITGAGTGLTSVSTQDSASVTWTGNGTPGSPLVATAAPVTTLYTGNGSLSSSRTVTGNSNSLFFLGLSDFLAEATTALTMQGATSVVSLNSTGGHLVGKFSAGNVGAFTATAQLHLGAGTAAATTAPLKLTPGVIMTTPEVGAIESDGDQLYFTINTGTARKLFPSILPASLVVDRVAFYSAAGLESSSLFRFSTSSTSLSIGGTPSSNAYLVLGAGSTTRAPLRFSSGTNMTTAIAGSIEYNGTNLFFTRVGTTRENVMTASAVTTETVVSDTTITVNINGVSYKLLAVPV